jgi:hypothetical protein
MCSTAAKVCKYLMKRKYLRFSGEHCKCLPPGMQTFRICWTSAEKCILQMLAFEMLTLKNMIPYPEARQVHDLERMIQSLRLVELSARSRAVYRANKHHAWAKRGANTWARGCRRDEDGERHASSARLPQDAELADRPSRSGRAYRRATPVATAAVAFVTLAGSQPVLHGTPPREPGRVNEDAPAGDHVRVPTYTCNDTCIALSGRV